MGDFPVPTDTKPFVLIHGDGIAALRALPVVPCVVLTDPPYGIELNNHEGVVHWSGRRRSRRREWDVVGDANLDVATGILAWADSREVPVVMFTSPYVSLPGVWRNILVWDKGGAVGGGGDPQKCFKRSFEMIYIRGNGDLRESRDSAVLRYPVSAGADFEFHPCQKPVRLLRYVIRQLSDPGDLIIDPCMGSGSTGVAALLEGRRFLGMEVVQEYHGIAEKRIRQRLPAYLTARRLAAQPGAENVDLFGCPVVE